MKVQGKVATWLEMVAAPHKKNDENMTLLLHAVEGREGKVVSPDKQCYVITVNGRWLCSSNGQITVLQGLNAAERFMRLIKLPTFEYGEPAEFDIDCNKGAHCIAIGRDKTLHGCVRVSQRQQAPKTQQ